MKGPLLKAAYIGQVAFVLAILTFAFQNCARVDHAQSGSQAQYSSNAGNGDAYSGKPEQYRHFDPNAKCSEKDLKGNALPNDEIFFQYQSSAAGKAPFVVRENCVDVAPKQIPSADLRFAADGTLIYKDKAYSTQNPPGDFDVVASSCPAGTTLKTGVTRTNLMLSAQDWTHLASPVQGWFTHQGIGVSLNGTINSLPSFAIVRNDPRYLDEFRRVSQHLVLQASTRYAFSFLGRAGSVGSARLRLYRDLSTDPLGEAITVDFNFLTGVANVAMTANMAAPQVAMVPVGNGFLCTVYFQTTAAGDQSVTDLGVSPTGTNFMGQLGDSVFATNALLERVQDFCQ